MHPLGPIRPTPMRSRREMMGGRTSLLASLATTWKMRLRLVLKLVLMLIYVTGDWALWERRIALSWKMRLRLVLMLIDD